MDLSKQDVQQLAKRLVGDNIVASASVSNLLEHWDSVSAFSEKDWVSFITKSSIRKMCLLHGGTMTKKMEADDLELAASLLEASLPLTPDHVLQEREREQLNAAMVAAGFDGTTKFRSVRWAMSELENALDPLGILIAGIHSASVFSQDTGQATVFLARKAGEMDAGTDITNASVSVKWHASQADEIEVTAHIA